MSTTITDNMMEDEQADLAEMLKLSREVDERLARKRVLAARIASRYGAAPDGSKVTPISHLPEFEEAEQRHAFDYLKTVGGKSKSQPMAAYVISKGGNLGASAKPGSALAPKLRKRPDVFGRGKDEWFLHPHEKWRHNR